MYHDNLYHDMMNQRQESTKTSHRGEIWTAPYNTMGYKDSNMGFEDSKMYHGKHHIHIGWLIYA